MAREVVQRKRRQKNGAIAAGRGDEAETAAAAPPESKNPASSPKMEKMDIDTDVGKKEINKKEEKVEQQIAPSTGKAPSSRQLNRIQNRTSIHSPYRAALTIPAPNNNDNELNSIIPSPRTPLRTPRSITTKRHDLWNLPLSPKSPSMRAYHTIVSFLSPSVAARNSAAFGKKEVDEEEQEKSEIWKGKQKEQEPLDFKDEDEDDEDDVISQLYPPLPSDPNTSNQIVIGSPGQSESQDTTKDLVSIIEQTIDEIEEDDDTRNSEDEEQEAEKEEQQEEQEADIGIEDQEEEEKVTEEEPVSVVKEDVKVDATSPSQPPVARGFSFLSSLRPTKPTFGEQSTIDLNSAQDQPSSSSSLPLESTTMPTLPPARSPFQSNGFAVPRLSTPSKMGFGVIASEPIDDSFKALSSSQQPEEKVFIPEFVPRECNMPRLPQYPRLSKPTRNISPLAKNYELLARFFAEKAEQETRADVPTSTDSVDEDVVEPSGALTEIELAGCMRLIEQSYAQGQGSEVERLRHEALQRGRLSRDEEIEMNNRMDEDEVHFANSHVGQRRSYLSRSPSLPLGAAAGEVPVAGHFGYHSRPSNSFLAPSYRSPEDVRINQSLATTFGPVSGANPVAKRKHRPLYLGPGVGASATSAILRRTQQSQTRRSALATQRASQQALLQPLSTQAGRESGAQAEDSEGPRKRRKLPETSESNPVIATTVSFSESALQSKIPSSQPAKSIPPSRTATADAMLSILSSGPSIPSRSPANSNAQGSKGDAEVRTTVNPTVVNPYETRSRLSRRSVVPESNTLTFSAAAKEKERLKQEREKRQKAIEEREARKESTLDFIKRTAPTAPVRRGRQIRLDDDDEEDEEDEEEEEVEVPKPISLPEAKKKTVSTSEEERQRKNEELKRRTELLTKKANSKITTADSGDKSKSTERQASGTATIEAKSSIPASKSFTFNSAFAPKKPSPLSQPTPDSPSASSVSSDTSTFKAFAAPSKSTVAPASKTSTIVIDDEKDDEVVEVPKVKAPLFNFGNSTTANEAKKAPSSAQPLFSFGGSKASEPSATASTSIPASSASATVSTPPFMFSKPASTESVPTAIVDSETTSDASSAREQALLIPTSDLPKFDFALSVVMEKNSKSVSSEIDEEARKSASSADVDSLPKYDFGLSPVQTQSSTSNERKMQSPSPFSFSNPSSTASPGFSFKAVPSSNSSSNTTQSIGKGANEATDKPASGKVAEGDQDSGGAASKATSALLSGVGEGEEDEDTLQESRCKVWSLSNGKWTDLGIGSLKIKKNKTTSKRRVLVRNEGNGKVTVNFNILSTFKPNLEKNFVTFLGFDNLGKPTNYRCKIKTEESAKELKEALETSAKEAAA